MEDVTEIELLQFMIEKYKISDTTILQEYKMNKRKELLEKHPCQVWQGKNNQYWYTYIPTENGRRLVKKKTRQQIEDVIIEYQKDEPTVDEVFSRWIADKIHYGEIQSATADRYKADYQRYFGKNKFRNRKIQTITETEIEDFIKDTILNYKLSSKSYSGLRTIIIGIFSYGFKHKYTNIAIRSFFNELRLSSKIFTHKVQLAEDNVFLEHEVKSITEYLLNNKPNVISYGIILAMRTGLRVGELCSLTKADIKDNCLRICKTETRYKVSEGIYTREVKDNAKTEAGNRYVLVDDYSMKLIEYINRQNPNGEYLFEINGKRCIGQSFTRKLERACRTLGIKPRSMHKCRKTYITTLINANVPESLIIEQVGHTDIRTSKQFYLYNNKTKADALRTLSDAISNQE